MERDPVTLREQAERLRQAAPHVSAESARHMLERAALLELRAQAPTHIDLGDLSERDRHIVEGLVRGLLGDPVPTGGTAYAIGHALAAQARGYVDGTALRIVQRGGS